MEDNYIILSPEGVELGSIYIEPEFVNVRTCEFSEEQLERIEALRKSVQDA